MLGCMNVLTLEGFGAREGTVRFNMQSCSGKDMMAVCWVTARILTSTRVLTRQPAQRSLPRRNQSIQHPTTQEATRPESNDDKSRGTTLDVDDEPSESDATHEEAQ